LAASSAAPSENGVPQLKRWPLLEDTMTQHNLRSHIAIAAAAIVLGAALAPVSAFAQARNPNDGGLVSVPAGAKLDGGSKAASTATTYGRNVDDGGMVTEPAQQVSAAPAKHSKAAAQQPAPVHFGRNVDDGGSVNQ
jgi:hypothetical protein